MTQILETDANTERATSTSAGAEPSRFVWYELHTPDTATAAAFYKPVLGWTTRTAGVENGNYTFVCAEEMPVGGLLEKPAKAFASGEKARWIGYIGVHDVAVLAKQVQQAGGTVHRTAEQIPGVGTLAVVADPEGAILALFEPPPGLTRPEQPAGCVPGVPAWHDLGAADWESEFEFYADLFGWRKACALDMRSHSMDQIFVGSQAIGGMLTLPAGAQGASWTFYFQVEEMEAAIARVKQNGGTLVDRPPVAPAGQQIARCLDTQGAMFGILGPRRQ